MLWVAKHCHFLRINNKPIKYWTPAGGTLDVGNFSIFLIFKTPRQTEHGATDLSIVNCWNYCLSQKQKPTTSFLNDILKKENYWASGSKHRKERQEGILESQADTNSFLREWLCELLNLRTISSCLCCNCWILLIMQLRVCIMKIMWFRLSKCFEHESWSSDISTLRIMVIVTTLHRTLPQWVFPPFSMLQLSRCCKNAHNHANFCSSHKYWFKKKKTWRSATQRECIALLTGKKTVNILDFIATL